MVYAFIYQLCSYILHSQLISVLAYAMAASYKGLISVLVLPATLQLNYNFINTL